MQKRLHSVVEVCLNTAIGFGGSWAIAEGVLYGELPNAGLVITLGCTVWSLARGYVLRRWFATYAQRSRPVAAPAAQQPYGQLSLF